MKTNFFLENNQKNKCKKVFYFQRKIKRKFDKVLDT